MPIMLKCAEWKGESKLKGFEDCFEVSSFQFGVGRAISSARGTSTREGNMASVSEITVTKVSDSVSTKLFEEALVGKMDKKVEIHFVRQGADGGVAYVVITLEGCGISGYSVSSGGDRPTESISLNFDKIEFGYNPVGDGLSGQYGGYIYDLATGNKA